MYHRSVHAELESIKDRVRSLVRHWPTDGAFKEDILKLVLRRHLPESLMIARGFVVTQNDASTEIDILIVDREKATVFKADDLVIVTPDAVKAVIEVKTSLPSKGKINKAIKKLAAIKRLLSTSRTGRKAWTGLFIYEGSNDKHEVLLRALGNAARPDNAAINCIAYGSDVIATFIDMREVSAAPPEDTHWRTGESPDAAPSLFLAYLISYLEATSNPQVWFPQYESGAWRFSLPLGARKPRELV